MSLRMRIRATILALLAAVVMNGQELTFRHYSDYDGLWRNAIRALAQDKYGYIWIGADAGLKRFDGISMRSFHTSNDKSVQSVYALLDMGDSLLVGTDDGAFVIDYISETTHRLNLTSKKGRQKNIHVTSLAVDKDSNVWVNIVNPFRGTWVVGTPGSGKTFSIIEPFIRQHSEKGFAMVVYDYKFPTLATKLYYHYLKNKNAKDSKMPHGMKFNIINFVDVEYSRRVNPIQLKYINNLAAASETAETLLESLQKGKKEGGGGSDQFFQTSAVNFLAACIYFFCNYGKEPYDKDGKMLIAERREDPKTKRLIPTGRVFDHSGAEVQPAYWLGKYSDMPHILSFLNESYQTIFEVLQTDNEVAPLLGPFQTAFANKAMEQLEGMIGTLRVYTSRLATKESYWIFHKDGDDFDLKVSDPKNPSYLLIANDPEMESIIGALNALILNRLVTRVNTGQGKNVPVSIIVDELPTLYFHKIDRLIGTARSNKVSVALGFQELPQLEADYGKVGMQKIITTVGNVVSGSARAKETLEWLSSDIFGKVVQLKKGVTIDRDKTSINLNENMDSLVPASKISDMPTGWICGQTARDFVVTKTGMNGSMNIQESEEFKTSKFYCKTDFDMTEIKKEESEYVPLPKFYKFKSKEERERILYKNFVQVGEDVKAMIKEIQQFRTMM